MLLLTQSGPLKSPAIPGQPHGAEFLIFARYRQPPLSVWRRLGEPQHRFLAPKAASVARVEVGSVSVSSAKGERARVQIARSHLIPLAYFIHEPIKKHEYIVAEDDNASSET